MENQKVINFIKHFNKNEGTVKTFTEGCCYWFAEILLLRFPNAVIVYDEVMNHFAAKIGDSVYDITGNVTDKYKWMEWENMTDESHRKRIAHYCIDFDVD